MTSCGLVLPAGSEKEGPPRKKAGLASFRLSGLKSRDQGGHAAWGWDPCCSGDQAMGKGSPSKVLRLVAGVSSSSDGEV